MSEIDNNERKEIIKEAITEWLDKQFALFGKLAFGSLFSIGLAAFLYFVLINSGWKK